MCNRLQLGAVESHVLRTVQSEQIYRDIHNNTVYLYSCHCWYTFSTKPPPETIAVLHPPDRLRLCELQSKQQVMNQEAAYLSVS